MNRTMHSAVCQASFVFLLLGIALTRSALAQDTVLHSFRVGDVPRGGLAASGGSVFGTTGFNATTYGTLFGIGTSGSNYRVLHAFTALGTDGAPGSDGGDPHAGPTLVGSTLWGTAFTSGPGIGPTGLHYLGGGANYRINIDGTGYQSNPMPYALQDFGANGPASVLTGNGNGALFGAAVGTARDFDFAPTNPEIYSLDSAGSYSTVAYFPTNYALGAAVAADSSLTYGTYADANRVGNVFSTTQVNISSDLSRPPSVLHTFNTAAGGSGAASSLLAVGGILYGTESTGGANNAGTLFAMNTNGSNFHVLHTFTGADGSGPGGLTVINGQLWGTASGGGAVGTGGVFSVDMDGANFIVRSLTGGTNHAAVPIGGLAFDGSNVYGMSSQGGLNNAGTLFAMPITADAPEPSSLVLAGLALAGLSAYAWRRKSRRRATAA